MTLLEKLKKEDYNEEILKEIFNRTLGDLQNEDGTPNMSAISLRWDEVITDEVKDEALGEVVAEEFDWDAASSEEIASIVTEAIGTMLITFLRLGFKGRLSSALSAEVE